MRSAPSFIGEFKHREKGRKVRTLRQELPIEREANVRQLKKQILQRLKKEPLLTDETDSGTVESEDNFDTANEKAVASSENHEGLPEHLHGEILDRVANSAFGKGSQGRRTELPFGTVDSSTSSIKLEQQKEEGENLVLTERRKKSTGERATILLHENQEGNYVPSFASHPPASSERQRKTDEIKQKAAERRRILEYQTHSSSPNVQVNDAPVRESLYYTPVASPSFGRRSGSALSVNISTTEDVVRRDANINNNFLAVSPRLTRASSFPSVYEAASGVSEDAHFKDFARKKQEKLEEDLRRVEYCLNQTFSDLKKYLKTE